MFLKSMMSCAFYVFFLSNNIITNIINQFAKNSINAPYIFKEIIEKINNGR